MYVVVPNTFNPTYITSSNVDAIEYQEYSPATTYNKGAYVDQDYKVYRSVTDDNTDDPTGFGEGVNAPTPTWVLMGYSNYVRMFTEGRDTVTTKTAGDLTVTFSYPSDTLIESIGILNTIGLSGNLKIFDESLVEVVNRDFEITDTSAEDWWEYYFTGYSSDPDHVFTGLPPYLGATVQITIEGGGEDTSIGRVVTGVSNFVGDLQYGTTVGRKRYRQYERDGFGNLVITPRRNTKRSTYSVLIDNTAIDNVQGYFDTIENEPTLFIGTLEDTGYSNSLNIFGVFNDFDINIEYFEKAMCTIEIEGY